MPVALCLHHGTFKLTQRALAVHNTRHASTLLHIFDPFSKTRFLIDTGVEVSVLPSTASQRSLSPALHLYSANGIKIPVFSHKTMQVQLSLRRSFKWTFYVVAVSQELLGADFLQHFGIVVDVRHLALVDMRQLVDPLTSLTTHMLPTPGASACLTVIKADTQFAALLKRLPTLLQLYSTARPVKHYVMHLIETSGRPTHAKVRRLAPERYKLAKAEFESHACWCTTVKLQQLVICPPHR